MDNSQSLPVTSIRKYQWPIFQSHRQLITSTLVSEPLQAPRSAPSGTVSPPASHSPHAIPKGAAPGHSQARRSRGGIPESQISSFWWRESETPRTRRVISEPSPSRYPRESISFPIFRDRPAPARDRVGFGSSSRGTN